MVDASINNGDVVIMLHTNAADDGDRVAVWLKDEEKTTLKRIFYENDGRIRLQPENKRRNPRYKDPNDVLVQGRVVEVISSSLTDD